MLVGPPAGQQAIREQETESKMQPSHRNRVILGGVVTAFPLAWLRRLPWRSKTFVIRWFGRPLLRSLVEIAIRIAVPFLTFFSGNGGSKFQKSLRNFGNRHLQSLRPLARAPRPGGDFWSLSGEFLNCCYAASWRASPERGGNPFSQRVATPLGFEPRITPPKGAVLPLHHGVSGSAILDRRFSIKAQSTKCGRSGWISWKELQISVRKSSGAAYICGSLL